MDPEALAREESVPGLLRATSAQLCKTLNAEGCVLSRVIGDVLVELVELAPPGRSFQLGLGYLISDYPLTGEVLRLEEARAVSLLDEEPDPAEAKLLKEFGYDSLLMLPLLAGGGPWGLVEVYAEGRRFTVEDAEVATAIAGHAGARLDELLRAEDDTAHFGRAP